MPHFFFHVRFDHHSRSRDELGLDFPDVETACAEAVRAAKDLRDEFVAQGQNPRDFAFVNIPGDTHFFFPFNQKFGEETVFNDRDTAFLGRRIDENFLLHRIKRCVNLVGVGKTGLPTGVGEPTISKWQPA